MGCVPLQGRVAPWSHPLSSAQESGPGPSRSRGHSNGALEQPPQRNPAPCTHEWGQDTFSFTYFTQSFTFLLEGEVGESWEEMSMSEGRRTRSLVLSLSKEPV